MVSSSARAVAGDREEDRESGGERPHNAPPERSESE